MKTNQILIFSLMVLSCNEKPDSKSNSEKEVLTVSGQKETTEIESQSEDYIVLDESSRKQITLKEPTLLIVQLDSVEMENAKRIDGEDNFYTAADDLNWYNSMVVKKYDSLNIPVLFSDKDYNEIKAPNLTQTITKDSTFSLFTYFSYNGENLQREDLMKLISE